MKEMYIITGIIYIRFLITISKLYPSDKKLEAYIYKVNKDLGHIKSRPLLIIVLKNLFKGFKRLLKVNIFIKAKYFFTIIKILWKIIWI